MSKQKEIPALFIRSQHEPYRRAGFAFTRNGVGIALEALSTEQIKAIKEDPRLIVEECTFPTDAAIDEATRLAKEVEAAEAAAKAKADQEAAEAAAKAKADQEAAEAAAKAKADQEAAEAAAKAAKGKGAK